MYIWEVGSIHLITCSGFSSAYSDCPCLRLGPVPSDCLPASGLGLCPATASMPQAWDCASPLPQVRAITRRLPPASGWGQCPPTAPLSQIWASAQLLPPFLRMGLVPSDCPLLQAGASAQRLSPCPRPPGWGVTPPSFSFLSEPKRQHVASL